MDHDAGENARAHLLIEDRPATGPEPHGHAVDCPRRGAIHLVECFECPDFSLVSFERETHDSFIDCRPKRG